MKGSGVDCDVDAGGGLEDGVGERVDQARANEDLDVLVTVWVPQGQGGHLLGLEGVVANCEESAVDPNVNYLGGHFPSLGD